MAVTTLVPYAAGNIAAMRMVTSLTQVDRQWSRYLMASVGIGALAFLLMLWSGLFFVRSIVRPLGEVEATATRIARGRPGHPPAGHQIQRRDRAACAGPSTRWRRTWPRPTG